MKKNFLLLVLPAIMALTGCAVEEKSGTSSFSFDTSNISFDSSAIEAIKQYSAEFAKGALDNLAKGEGYSIEFDLSIEVLPNSEFSRYFTLTLNKQGNMQWGSVKQFDSEHRTFDGALDYSLAAKDEGGTVSFFYHEGDKSWEQIDYVYYKDLPFTLDSIEQYLFVGGTYVMYLKEYSKKVRTVELDRNAVKCEINQNNKKSTFYVDIETHLLLHFSTVEFADEQSVTTVMKMSKFKNTVEKKPKL